LCRERYRTERAPRPDQLTRVEPQSIRILLRRWTIYRRRICPQSICCSTPVDLLDLQNDLVSGRLNACRLESLGRLHVVNRELARERFSATDILCQYLHQLCRRFSCNCSDMSAEQFDMRAISLYDVESIGEPIKAAGNRVKRQSPSCSDKVRVAVMCRR